MNDDKTPDEIYDEFWKDLVETDGVMDPEFDQLARENMRWEYDILHKGGPE